MARVIEWDCPPTSFLAIYSVVFRTAVNWDPRDHSDRVRYRSSKLIAILTHHMKLLPHALPETENSNTYAIDAQTRSFHTDKRWLRPSFQYFRFEFTFRISFRALKKQGDCIGNVGVAIGEYFSKRGKWNARSSNLETMESSPDQHFRQQKQHLNHFQRSQITLPFVLDSLCFVHHHPHLTLFSLAFSMREDNSLKFFSAKKTKTCRISRKSERFWFGNRYISGSSFSCVLLERTPQHLNQLKWHKRIVISQERLYQAVDNYPVPLTSGRSIRSIAAI
jgi:hypothetical protein